MLLLQNWGEVFSQSLIGLWYGFINFIPGLLGAIILFIVGFIVGKVVGKAITQLVAALKVDRLFASAGANDFMERAGLKLSVSGFIGGLVKWFIVIVFLMASLQIIGLTQVNDFLSEAVLYYLPKVIIAALVLVIATILADAMKKLVKASAQAANIRSANMLGSITLYSIWIFAFIIALSELGIATAFMQILFTGLIAALAIALGLAFGLGGKEAASRAVEKFSVDMSSDNTSSYK
jgi:small-conductance mechanosensitive channel